jgi:hypothetical protein
VINQQFELRRWRLVPLSANGMQTVMAERPESCSDEQDSVSVAHLMTAKQTAKGPETANENVRFMILGAGIAGKSAVKPALDRRSFTPTLSIPMANHSVPNLYRMRINYRQKICCFSFETKPPTALTERLSYPKTTLRHFD